MSGVPEVGMRCALSSEVGTLLGLLPLLVCASFDALEKARSAEKQLAVASGGGGGRGGGGHGAIMGGSRGALR